jgi:hypothetical protein
MKFEIFNFENEGYDRVALFDTDTIIADRIDELFDDDAFYYVRDCWLGGGCWNSGFMIASPSQYLYDLFVSTYLTFDYGRRSSGWADSWHGGCYSGGEMQGLSAYIFERLLPQKFGWEQSMSVGDQFDSTLYGRDFSRGNKTHPRAIELDFRVYNLLFPNLLHVDAHSQIVKFYHFAGHACYGKPMDESFNWNDPVCGYFGAIFGLTLARLQNRFPDDVWAYGKMSQDSIRKYQKAFFYLC